MTEETMVFKRLDSGHYFARWHTYAFTQWPVGVKCQREHFFQPEWSYTPERCDNANIMANAPEGAP